MDKPTILICNDDGYMAKGLAMLREALRPLGRVITVAPDQDNSGVSHKITLHSALRLHRMEEDVYTVTGTPVDCIHLGLHGVLDGRMPDLLVSGINHGLNLGEDTAYSGTVAAAYEGFIHGIPSMAVSTGSIRKGGFQFENAARVAQELAASFLSGTEMLRRTVWNVNVPGEGRIRGFRVVSLDSRSFQSSVVKREDPRGVPYYWIGPYYPKFDNAKDTDFAAYHEGYVSITPLKVEMTHQGLVDELRESPSALNVGDLKFSAQG